MESFKSALKNSWIFMVYAAVGLVYGLVNRPWGTIRNISTVVDGYIPFVKEFIVPYTSWHIFTIAIGIFLLFKDKRNYYKTMYSLIIGLTVCYGIYIVFQTTVPRPLIVGDDFFSKMVKVTYGNDKPFNCFPSIHVYSTLVLTHFALKANKLKKYQSGILIIWSVAIIVSTLFVKQHVILDAVGAGGLAYVCIGLINWIEARNGVKINSAVENEGQA